MSIQIGWKKVPSFLRKTLESFQRGGKVRCCSIATKWHEVPQKTTLQRILCSFYSSLYCRIPSLCLSVVSDEREVNNLWSLISLFTCSKLLLQNGVVLGFFAYWRLICIVWVWAVSYILHLILQAQVWKPFQRSEPVEVFTEYSCFQRLERR